MTFSILNVKEIGKKYQEGNVHTTYISKSHSRGGSHISQRQNDNKVMQRKIDDLKKKLRRAQRKQSPSSSYVSSNDEEDVSYRWRSRTLPSESFSCDEERHHQRKYKSSPHKEVANDIMSKVLNQISKSPFTRKIEGAKLPWRFHQPTFTIYNGRTDPIEHVNQFNQRMAVHSKVEALMCKIFPSSLGLGTCDDEMV